MRDVQLPERFSVPLFFPDVVDYRRFIPREVGRVTTPVPCPVPCPVPWATTVHIKPLRAPAAPLEPLQSGLSVVLLMAEV